MKDVANLTPEDQAALQRIAQRMPDPTRYAVSATWWQWWCILGTLQFMLRAPESTLGAPIRALLLAFTRQLATYITADDPLLAEHAERGFNPAYDQPQNRRNDD